MISAEYAPFAKTGGLADMVAGLCRTLAGAGHDVRVILPRYTSLTVDPQDRLPGSGLQIGALQVSPVRVKNAHPGYHLLQALTATGEPLIYQLDAPLLFGSGGIYGGGELEARRFALLAHGALRLCELLDWSPDIVHCHDWHAALVPGLLKRGYLQSRVFRSASSVLTLHNIGYQGVFPAALAGELGLSTDPEGPQLNFLRAGILDADALTTVSPSHAAEILTPEYGKGLERLLRERRNRLVGILNGVDYAAWDPATDPRLPARYNPQDISGKTACREALMARADLNPQLRVPVLGMVTRLAEQKGIELVLDALPGLLRERGVQAVILGQGEERYSALLRQLANAFPNLLRFFEVQDEGLARLVYAGADAFLVPSIYEPCGLTQMYALRYGAVPVVRETGGLKDTVRHFDAGSRTGNGSVFKHANGAGLTWALRELLGWYRQPELWAQLRRNGMLEDYSWQHQAPRYLTLYNQLTGGRQ